MNHRDIAGVMTAAAPAFRDYVVRAVSPLVDRLLSVEKLVRDLPVPKDGRDADPVEIAKMVSAEVARLLPGAVEAAVVAKEAALAEIERVVTEKVEKAVSAIPVPVNGKDADPVDLDEVAARAAKLIPMPENGKDADIEAVRSIIVEEVAKVIPENGKDADPEVIRSMVAAEVSKIERPKDGKDASAEAIKVAVLDVVAEILPGEVSSAVDKIEKPKDGKDIDPLEVAALVSAEVEKAVGAIGKPADGKSVTVDDVRPLLEELVSALPVPQDGKDIDPETVRLMVVDEVAKIEKPKDGIDGKSVDIGDLIQVVEAEVAHAMAAIDPPKDGEDGEDGKSVTVDDVRPLLEELVAALPVPVNGKDADPVEVAALIVDDVAKLVPVPADGKSVTVEQVLPFIEEMVEKRVAQIPVPKDGKDGVGTAGAVIDRSGELVLTLSDGSTKALGIVVGKDADQAEIIRFINEKVAEIPRPKDGRDGFGFEDLEATFDGERTIGLKFTRGDQVKEFSFKMPVVIDRGVYKDGREQPYEKGDGVTFGGSFWIAQKDGPEGKPQDGSKDWRLSVKRGRNGVDGVVRTIPPQGPVKSDPK